ncbi:MAG: hypothetical protein KGL39_23800 [Patescibacteria group bacterium]|nr:hypothetical protein [Patescibacteria group bacterium]
MKKEDAIAQLGGSKAAAAKAIGCTYQAVHAWPEVLPPRIADRVTAALTRMQKNKSSRSNRENKV